MYLRLRVVTLSEYKMLQEATAGTQYLVVEAAHPSRGE